MNSQVTIHKVRGERSASYYQRGVGVLLVAIVLLGIATVMTLFSLGVGLYDQRTTSNESRYKMANAAAQAGLDQGLEFFKANLGDVTGCWLFPTMTSCTAGLTSRWTRCGAGDAFSPCGAVPASVRANYFYYNDSNGRLSGADPTSLNLALDGVTGSSTGQAVTTMGNFSVDYEVNALLCLTDTVTPTNQCLTTSEFNSQYVTGTLQGQPYGVNTYSASGLYTITMVSRSQLAAVGATDTENAQVVLKETTAAYSLLGKGPDAPLVAANSIQTLGDADIVTNPNGGGTGIPLSIWSAACIHVSNVVNSCNDSSNASFNSCYSDEFFKTGTTGTYHGSTVCPAIGSNSGKCGCSKIASLVGNNSSPFGLGVLSGHVGNNGMAGADLLGIGVQGILPDTHFFPLYPLNIFRPGGPSDTGDLLDDTPFEYVFGVDVADGTSVMKQGTSNTTVDAATDYLSDPKNFTPLDDCSTLSSSSKGLYWHAKGKGQCTVPDGVIGSPEKPVVLVAQTDFKLSGNSVFFGIIFIRSQAGWNTATGTGDQLTTTTAGYDVTFNGGQVYGSIVMEGAANLHFNGSMQLIYDANTLAHIPSLGLRLGVLPGSWSDAGRIDVTNSNRYSE